MAEKSIHPNIEAMQELVDTYGIEALQDATGYTYGSLVHYLRPNGKVIPNKKLENTRIVLEAKYPR